MVKLFGQA
jgi:hypothetical protein